MSTFLFYNPNSNPSRYSQKARFSKRQSVLLGSECSTLNTELHPQVNRGSASSVPPAQFSTRNNCDLQPAEPAHYTASRKSIRSPNQDNGAFSNHDISDVESLHSLFFGTDPGASTRSPEAGESIARRNTETPLFDDKLVPVKGDAPITQPDCRLGRQASVCDSDQPSETPESRPDLATYCLNISPSPIPRDCDVFIADDHASSHQSSLVCPLQADDPRNFAGSVASWESNGQCTTLSDDEMQVNAENGGTSNDQCIVRRAADFRQPPAITSSELTETSCSSYPCYSNGKDSFSGIADGPALDPKIHPLALVEETCLCDLDNTTSVQLREGDETENGAPDIAEAPSESNLESPTIHAGAHSEAGAQGHASARPTTPPEPIVESPIVLADVSSASDKSAPARSSSRISSHQSSRKRFAEFSHVEIPSRPLAEASRPSVETAPLDRSDESCHPSLTNGPWRLDGTILSIDLRDAEQVPIFVGYSSFRVYDGKLTQSVTFFQGSVGGQPVNKSACAAGKPSPRIPARGPLPLEQKQRLVDLRQKGYTWDEIVTQFPGRKRSNLQAIYSRCVKNFRSLGSRHNDTSKRPSSVLTSSLDHRSLAEIAGNGRIKAGRTNHVKKSRYNLRANGSR
ncbi:uncharacterized protein BDV17DRAFT_2873 [Aspergillus undulatus]|uniref:uncharacterized protein n=1 Tax=Aspergillus undulatus TaxID=1810928 RepID=UPI003CCD44D4